jgi:hypothetical protein
MLFVQSLCELFLRLKVSKCFGKMPNYRSLPLLSFFRSAGLTGFFLILIIMLLISGKPATADDLTIYADNLASGWENWSWDTTVNFSNVLPVHAGLSSIALTLNAAWAGFYLTVINGSLTIERGAATIENIIIK